MRILGGNCCFYRKFSAIRITYGYHLDWRRGKTTTIIKTGVRNCKPLKETFCTSETVADPLPFQWDSHWLAWNVLCENVLWAPDLQFHCQKNTHKHTFALSSIHWNIQWAHLGALEFFANLFRHMRLIRSSGFRIVRHMFGNYQRLKCCHFSFFQLFVVVYRNVWTASTIVGGVLVSFLWAFHQ